MHDPPEGARHLTRLAELFVAHATVVLSGERLAQELGVSRSSVWRGIEQLRQYGMQLRGHRASGYQLEAMPDLLLPALVAPHRKSGSLGRRVHHFFRIDSTQRAALGAAAQGEPHGSLFIAEEQTGGRGRHGRCWASPAGEGIYMSLLLRPPGPPAAALALSLAAGVAVAAAIRLVTGLAPDLRWPNDVLLDRRKVAGLLLEMSAEPTRVQHLVLGIGVNVHQTEFSPDLAPLATSLRLAAGRDFSRLELLAEILFQLEARYQAFVAGGADDLLAEFARSSSYVQGLRVRVGEGAEAYEGVTSGLDGQGFLRIRRDDGSLTTVIAGNVRTAPPPAAD